MRQSFSYTLLITWILLSLSCKNHFVQKSYTTKNISVSTDVGAMDSSLVQLYTPYKNVLGKDMKRVISKSEVELRKDKPESLLTNFLGDLLLAEGIKEAQKRGYDFIPAVSFSNYGGIRTPLPKGEITVQNVFELMPFENEMVFLELGADQMHEFLNYVARKGGDSVGGVRFVISNGVATNITIGGKALTENDSYWVVTNDYVANGGDGLDVFKECKQFIKSDRKIRDAIIAHLEEMHKNEIVLNPKLDGRISNETSSS